MTLPEPFIVVRCAVQPRNAFRLSIPTARCGNRPTNVSPHREHVSVQIRCGSGRVHRGFIAVLAPFTIIKRSRDRTPSALNLCGSLSRWSSPLVKFCQEPASGVFQTLKSLFVFRFHVRKQTTERFGNAKICVGEIHHV